MTLPCRPVTRHIAEAFPHTVWTSRATAKHRPLAWPAQVNIRLTRPGSGPEPIRASTETRGLSQLLDHHARTPGPYHPAISADQLPPSDPAQPQQRPECSGLAAAFPA